MSELPRVLLLGDSIRQSYQPIVINKLSDRAQVVAPKENSQFSLYTLVSLARWVEDLGKPKIVHWNNGFHDFGLCTCRRQILMLLEDYIGNLEFILNDIKKISTHIIWATSTAVHPNRPFTNDAWSWRNEEIDKYNQAAIELMNKHDIPINDLNKIIAGNPDDYLAEDQVHLSQAGQQACANAVVNAISTYL
jgi:lysophospholipase L1-like esterase